MRYILFFVLLINHIYAKKDFYYGYINDNKNQIQKEQSDAILQINKQVIHIKDLVKKDEIYKAYAQILLLRDRNKIKLLNSSIELLYGTILYQKDMEKFVVKANRVMKEAINNGIINDNDLLDSLRLLVNINLKLGKIQKAKYYAKTILNTFKDSLSQVYGNISLAMVDKHQKRYKQAIKKLYRILIKTNNLQVATLVADRLFDIYILDNQRNKAYNLTRKVLSKNMDYYSLTPSIALKKIDKLLKVNMPLLAIEILEDLIKKAIQRKDIVRFKYKLANIYMTIGYKDDVYIAKAKELYKDLIRDKRNKINKAQSKMYLDEILMRQGVLTPELVAIKYPNSKSVYYKTLMQKLLNKKKDYEHINRLKNIYKKIDSTITKRFGYKNIQEVFDIIYSDMLKDYLDNNRCKLLNNQIVGMDNSTLHKLIQDKKYMVNLFQCMLEIPNKKAFRIARKVYKEQRDGYIYFSLEKIALKLDLNKDALELSHNIDMLNDDKLKSDEFLYKFLIYGKQNNSYSMNKFFTYTLQHKEYITNNQDNPIIIDFYYQYYLYFIKHHKDKEATKVLELLYKKQNDMKAYIYSPFVELKMASSMVLNDDYNGSIKYLELGLKNTRRIKGKDLVKIYYEMAQSYKKLGKQNRYKKSIEQCKDVKNVKSLYKNMCDKL